MKAIGRHVILEMWGCQNLDSVETAEQALREMVVALDVNLLDLQRLPIQPGRRDGYGHRLGEPSGRSTPGPSTATRPSISSPVAHRAIRRMRSTCCAACYEPERIGVMEINRGQFDLPEYERAARQLEHRAAAAPRATARCPPTRPELSRTPVDDWFAEPPYAGIEQRYRVLARLHSQTDAVADPRGARPRGPGPIARSWRGTLQTSLGEEFTYHEPLVHIPMFAHPNPHRVLIIGGGDGGALRHVLLHPSVDRALEVEIDQAVVEASLRFLPEISRGAYTDPRAELQNRRRRARFWPKPASAST